MKRITVSTMFVVVSLLTAAAFVLPAALADHHEKNETRSEAWTTSDTANIERALHHPDRPTADKERDGDRLPVSVLSFFQIKKGMNVADMMSGRGYYTEVLSRVVGEEGKVYAHNNQYVVQRFADAAITKRLEDDRLPNVIRVDAELEEPGLPKGEMDAIFMGLFYHDTYWMEADRAAMNKAIFDALRPGGVYCITDHHAEAGSKDRDVKTLHRVDAEIVKQEILAAGFVLEAETDILRNNDDDRTINVFKPEIRGKTDRFVYKFRKPE